jgi:glycosyltransferase involved in cell wall biosynthesis
MNRIPRVMLTVGSYDKQGGTNTFTRNLSSRLSNAGIYTVVMSQKLRGENFDDRKINDNLYVHYFPPFPRKRYFLPFYALRFLWMAIHVLFIIKKHKINVLLTGETEALPYLAAKIFGVKIIIRGGNPFPEVTKLEFNRKKRLFNFVIFFLIDIYEKIILRFADEIVILSEWERTIIENYTNKKPIIIRYAVDTSLFVPSKRSKKVNLLYIGRISFSKNIPLLIKLFEKIKEKINTQLVLIGQLEGYSSINDLIQNSRFKKDIIYQDEVKAKDVPNILKGSFIFVHVAHDLGNAPLEAAAAGLPVVVLGEKFDEKYVLKNKDERKFVSIIINLLKNNPFYKEISKKNRKIVLKEHSWETISIKYISLFKKVLYQKKSKKYNGQ